MPVTGDLATPLCAALVAILSGNASIHALCGRTERLVVPFEDINDADPDEPLAQVALPVLVYTYGNDTEIGGIGDQRLATIIVDAIAEGDNSWQTVCELQAYARAALSWNAFDAQGLDAVVRAPVVRDGAAADPEATRGLRILRATYTIWATAP